MNQRVAAALAWSFWGMTMIFTIVSVLLPATGDDYTRLTNALGALIVIPIYATVGAFVAARRPANPIGWIVCVGVLMLALSTFTESYATFTLVIWPGVLPGGVVVAWIMAWIGTAGFGLLFTFPFLLFPEGQLLTPRWRPVAWLVAGLIILQNLALAFKPGSLGALPINNPLGITATAGLSNWMTAVAPNLGTVGVVLSAVSLIWRFRRARTTERQQLKWVAFAATVTLVPFLSDAVVEMSGLAQSPTPLEQFIVNLVFILAVSTFPISIAIAILRYRLFDIDLIIRRTLSYSVLTGLLAVTYFGVIIALQFLFRAVTGEGQNQLVTVASTLAIAALFFPLRNRVQEFIDKRFYRRKYDAQKVLAEFAATARDETDLDKLTARLVEVIEETMQPESVGVWLRDTSWNAKAQHPGREETDRPAWGD